MTSWDGADFRASIQEALDEFLDEMTTRLEPLGPDAGRLLAEARRSVSGGKRFRAAFCYWGFRAVRPDVDDERALLRACAALELLHASALVHDDYMDASDTRRGRPATHRAFEAEHRGDGWRGDPHQYGASAAILLGDLLLSWADEMLRRCGLPLPEVMAALDVFDLCRTEVIAGQFLDVSAQARGRADVETAMTVLRYKSAKYSIERPLHIGAALAGGSTARPWPTCRRTASRWARRSSCATTCSACSATPTPPASPPATTWSRASGPSWSRSPSTARPPRTPPCWTARSAPRSTPAAVERLRRVIDDSGAHAQVESVIAGARSTSPSPPWTGPGSTTTPAAVLRRLAAAATDRVV